MTIDAPVMTGRRRIRVRIRGTVQGVGFRPYVYRLANELGLGGFVFNDSHGVVAEVEGSTTGVQAFLIRLGPDAPRLAVLEEVECEERPPAGGHTFAILRSPASGIPDAAVTPDSATCDACLRELRDPTDRRFRYPFINCTDCGPRFTIVTGVPYDRPLTTMASFAMCPECRTEYEDPRDRRFHAQPNACPRCGPTARLLAADGHPVDPGATDGVEAAARALGSGAILAVKGLGGYHLACCARDERAVATLRARKHREEKPFALMARSVADALTLVELGDWGRRILMGPQRPIVLGPRRSGAPVAAAVAPGAPELGVMLPYSPLHHLLLADSGPLVLTSGNVSDEPIAYRDEDALQRLAGIADLFLVHDRPIQTRTDDSILRVVRVGGRSRAMALRRSRGYVPAALPLPGAGAPCGLLACGAELKNTFCLARGRHAWMSHHVGDLENYETLRSFTDGIAHFSRLFAVAPEVVAHDRHPEYMSTKYAQDLEGVRLIEVQHHHAHLAACLAEHGVTGQALGVIFDGSGYGTDGTVWGGEWLLGDIASSRRVGSLLSVSLPGGRRAIEEPWRMACAWLTAACGPNPGRPSWLPDHVTPERWRAVARLAADRSISVQTTSMGRLFDAVAALVGLRPRVSYEGQAAIQLEALAAAGSRDDPYPIGVGEAHGRLLLDPRDTILAVLAGVRAGTPRADIARRFHATIAAATVAAAGRLAEANGVDIVALSGGVFQNRRLLESVSDGLHERGLRALVPERLPVNDGQISYGQAASAAARLWLTPTG